MEVGIKPEKLDGRIEFRDVSFSYPSRIDASVFQKLNFVVEPGTHVAIVGGSGSGKSTVAQLLLRFYDPTHGAVFLDGYNLKDLNILSLRKNWIAYVSQEPVLFATSIRENISYGHPDASEEDIRRAADLANATKFIEDFPLGFDTYVGEKGVALSGGQKQRIAIARALLKNPKILVLDEATSALDAASENLVQDAISKIVHGRTVVTIAHRLSTIQEADTILLLEDGKVVESGSYADLVAPDTRFHSLISSQLKK